MKKMLNEGYQILYTILYCVFVRTFVIPFYDGSGTVIVNGSSSYSTWQKVMVPTVPVPIPVPQHCTIAFKTFTREL
jgi:hypothetical protein